MSNGDLIGAAMAELDQLREAMLDYNAATDRSGEAWDALRVKLDERIGVARSLLAIKRKADAIHKACRDAG